MGDVHPVKNCRGINATLWNFFQERYGGGPRISKRSARHARPFDGAGPPAEAQLL